MKIPEGNVVNLDADEFIAFFKEHNERNNMKYTHYGAMVGYINAIATDMRFVVFMDPAIDSGVEMYSRKFNTVSVMATSDGYMIEIIE